VEVHGVVAFTDAPHIGNVLYGLLAPVAFEWELHKTGSNAKRYQHIGWHVPQLAGITGGTANEVERLGVLQHQTIWANKPG